MMALKKCQELKLMHADVSIETSKLMDILGYGKELRQKRREYYRENDRLWNSWPVVAGILITVGSKAEGLTCYSESDKDFLLEIQDVKCLEDVSDINAMPEQTALFSMDTRLCYPGHCRLVLERGFPLLLLSALCEDGYGLLLLSSYSFLNIFATFKFSPGPGVKERAGPSLPYSYGPWCNIDAVYALRCHCPTILQRWATRPRHWPQPDIVQKVVSMGSFVTPVGFKESEYEHVEWRICFNTGESELVTNLNDTQVKLYVLLKMIKQDLLKPRNKEITSYTLKNIVLWLAENNPQTLFHEMSLFFWLREALSELRRAISSKKLPYFIIPERNLMASCKLTDAQQRRWISKITDLIDEGPIIIQRLPRMRRAIIAHPETLRWFYMRRLELEILILEEMNRQNRSSNSNLAVNCFDGIFRQEPTRRMFKIVFEILNRMCPDERNLLLLDCSQILFRILS